MYKALLLAKESHEGESPEDHAAHSTTDAEGQHADHEGETHGFPLVYVIFFCGFMIMLVLDQVIFKPAQKLIVVKKN